MVATSTLTSGIGWNDISGRYINLRTGQFVPQTAVSNALQQTIDTQAKTVANLTTQFKNGAVTLAEWRTGMAQSVKVTHLASSALANGGWAQMTQADYGRVGQLVRQQYAYLDRFASDIASGKQKFDGTLDRRAKMYTDAGRQTYESARRAEDRLRGLDEERNIRYDGDSCDGCIEAEAMGWQPVGVIPLPGTRDCRTNCRCRLERRRSAA
jgi:hypothetical protein